MIIPTSDNSYVARDTNPDVKNSKVCKEGKSHIFNLEALSQESDEPIFIVEGEIDALSVIEVGGQAIGLGGVSNINRLISEMEKERESSRKRFYIIYLDNDEAGKKAAKKMEEEFGKAGYAYLNKTEELMVGCKDFNEALVKDKAKAKETIEKIIVEARERKEQEEEDYHLAYEASVRADFDWFYKERNAVPTGIAPLDEFLDGGLYAGLYVLAATSSAGKTTFALQIADNMAKEKTDVLFFSGEMQRRELLAKSISRLNKEVWDEGKEEEKKKPKEQEKNNPNSKVNVGANPLCLTSRAIQNLHSYNNSDYTNRVGGLTENCYLTFSKHIRIEDGLQEINAIKTKIEVHKRITGNNPVVFVDYLQLVKTDIKEASFKERRLQIDEIVSNLRLMSADYQTPIFVISSLNRAAYDGHNKNRSEKEEVSMADLKESGGIEYGADVILTLSYDENAEKSGGDFRNMKLRIIKNRTGRRHGKDEDIKLKFYPKYNLFEEDKEGKGRAEQEKRTNENNKEQVKKKHADTFLDVAAAAKANYVVHGDDKYPIIIKAINRVFPELAKKYADFITSKEFLNNKEEQEAYKKDPAETYILFSTQFLIRFIERRRIP